MRGNTRTTCIVMYNINTELSKLALLREKEYTEFSEKRKSIRDLITSNKSKI